MSDFGFIYKDLGRTGTLPVSALIFCGDNHNALFHTKYDRWRVMVGFPGVRAMEFH